MSAVATESRRPCHLNQGERKSPDGWTIAFVAFTGCYDSIAVWRQEVEAELDLGVMIGKPSDGISERLQPLETGTIVSSALSAS